MAALFFLPDAVVEESSNSSATLLSAASIFFTADSASLKLVSNSPCSLLRLVAAALKSSVVVGTPFVVDDGPPDVPEVDFNDMGVVGEELGSPDV